MPEDESQKKRAGGPASETVARGEPVSGAIPRGAPEEERALRLLGLSRRARRVVAGMDIVLAGLATGEVVLLLVAGDAADGSAEKAIRRAKTAGIPWVTLGDRAQLGHCFGKASCAIAGLTDEGFASAILKLAGLEGLASGSMSKQPSRQRKTEKDGTAGGQPGRKGTRKPRTRARETIGPRQKNKAGPKRPRSGRRPGGPEGPKGPGRQNAEMP